MRIQNLIDVVSSTIHHTCISISPEPMNIKVLLAGLIFLLGIILTGVGAGLDIFPALVAGILLIAISGAIYMMSLFHVGSALPRNTRPVIVV
jgi:hypothetical protein